MAREVGVIVMITGKFEGPHHQNQSTSSSQRIRKQLAEFAVGVDSLCILIQDRVRINSAFQLKIDFDSEQDITNRNKLCDNKQRSNLHADQSN
jgi:hypothetical protein